jgi:hypothetical protein
LANTGRVIFVIIKVIKAGMSREGTLSEEPSVPSYQCLLRGLKREVL